MKGSTKDIKIASFENALNKVPNCMSEYLWRYEVGVQYLQTVDCAKLVMM